MTMDAGLRKRTYPETDESQSFPTKKRAVADENDAPRANGTPADGDSDDAFDPAKLETFRKQAIYRRMKEYSRANERNRAELELLQERNRNSEEGLKALVSCWSQLINTIHALVPSESVYTQEPDPPAIFDLISRRTDHERLAEIQATVDNSVKATRALVTKFMSSGDSRASSSQHNAFQECQTKCAELEISYLDAKRKLDDTEERLADRERELEVVQARYERLRTTQHLTGSPPPGPREVSPQASHEPVSNGADIAMGNASEAANASQGVVNELSDLNQSLQAEIKQLRAQIKQLQDENKNLTWTSADLPDHRVEVTGAYIKLKGAASFYQLAAKKAAEEKEELFQTVKSLTEEKSSYQDLAKSAASAMEQDYQSKLEKRSIENARLRQERDQARIALREREVKDATPAPSFAQLEALQKSQAVRLDAALSEVRRLRARLADASGNTELLRFLLTDYSEENFGLVEHLQARIQELEEQISTLQHDGSGLPEDSAQLAGLLRQRDEGISKLKATEAQLRQDLAAAETDFITVSSAYDDIEKQLRDKVFELMHRDKSFQELSTMRQKAESKYLAVQAERDARDQERLAALREKEAVEALLNKKDAQISNLFEGKKQAELIVLDLKNSVTRLENTHLERDQKLRTEEATYYETKSNFQTTLDKVHLREKKLTDEEFALRDRQSQVAADRKKLDRDRKVFEAEKDRASLVKLSASERDMQQEIADLKEFAKCSICRVHFRNRVIISCGHTFCEKCVEDRVQSRNRQCMSCSNKFAHSDVRAIY